MKELNEMILKGEITKERVDELMKMSDEELQKDLTDGETVCEEYYFNTFYIQKYEDDDDFMNAGTGISNDNHAIRIIQSIRDKGEETVDKEYEDNKAKELKQNIDELRLLRDKAYIADQLTLIEIHQSKYPEYQEKGELTLYHDELNKLENELETLKNKTYTPPYNEDTIRCTKELTNIVVEGIAYTWLGVPGYKELES